MFPLCWNLFLEGKIGSWFHKCRISTLLNNCEWQFLLFQRHCVSLQDWLCSYKYCRYDMSTLEDLAHPVGSCKSLVSATFNFIMLRNPEIIKPMMQQILLQAWVAKIFVSNVRGQEDINYKAVANIQKGNIGSMRYWHCLCDRGYAILGMPDQ